MPAYKNGYYRRNRQHIEYWLDVEDYANGARPDGTVRIPESGEKRVFRATHHAITLIRRGER